MAAQLRKIGCAMNTFFSKQVKGFTIIELMIVILIVAILVALAYPSYINYVRKAKRGEAQQLLLNWSINQEIWRSNNATYNGEADDTAAGYIIPAHENYTFAVSNVTGTTYTLSASAQNDQANDKARDGSSCSPLALDQSGVKSPPACWD